MITDDAPTDPRIDLAAASSPSPATVPDHEDDHMPTFIDPKSLPDETKTTLRDLIRGLFLMTTHPSEIAGINPTYKVVLAEDGTALGRHEQRLALRDAVRIYVQSWTYPVVLRAYGLDPDQPVTDLLVALDDEVGALAFELEALTCPDGGRWSPIRHILRLTQIEVRLAALFGLSATGHGHQLYAWDTVPHQSHQLIETIRPALARFHDAMAQLEHEQVKARAGRGAA